MNRYTLRASLATMGVAVLVASGTLRPSTVHVHLAAGSIVMGVTVVALVVAALWTARVARSG